MSEVINRVLVVNLEESMKNYYMNLKWKTIMVYPGKLNKTFLIEVKPFVIVTRVSTKCRSLRYLEVTKATKRPLKGPLSYGARYGTM